jgi:hypothetical protein
MFEDQPLSKQDQVEAAEEEQGRRQGLAELMANEQQKSVLVCATRYVDRVRIGSYLGVQAAGRFHGTERCRSAMRRAPLIYPRRAPICPPWSSGC